MCLDLDHGVTVEYLFLTKAHKQPIDCYCMVIMTCLSLSAYALYPMEWSSSWPRFFVPSLTIGTIGGQ